MRVEENPPTIAALTYLRDWLKATYDSADDWRVKSLRARLDDSGSDAVRADCARRAIDAEDLAGQIGEVLELLERDVAELVRRKPVTHWRFNHVSDAVWVPDLDPPA